MNDKERQEAYLKIMNHYGYEAQRNMLVEECAETIQAVQKCKRYGTKEAFEHLLGEIADLIVVTTQMYNFCGTGEIDRIIDEKLRRQLERIEKEKQE